MFAGLAAAPMMLAKDFVGVLNFPLWVSSISSSISSISSISALTPGLGYEADAGYAGGRSNLNWAKRFDCGCTAN